MSGFWPLNSKPEHHPALKEKPLGILELKPLKILRLVSPALAKFLTFSTSWLTPKNAF
jgi:hypothetical protein